MTLRKSTIYDSKNMEALQSANVVLWLSVKPVSMLTPYKSSLIPTTWEPWLRQASYCFLRPQQVRLLEALWSSICGTLCCQNLAGQDQEYQLCLAWKACTVLKTPSITEPPIWNHHKTCPEGSWNWIQVGIFPFPYLISFSESIQVTLSVQPAGFS